MSLSITLFLGQPQELFFYGQFFQFQVLNGDSRQIAVCFCVCQIQLCLGQHQTKCGQIVLDAQRSHGNHFLIRYFAARGKAINVWNRRRLVILNGLGRLQRKFGFPNNLLIGGQQYGTSISKLAVNDLEVML